ncbi:MAG TPA: undecaprenyl-diphosphatase UppP [Chthonomonadaceae bacterium]|nr:undecaprenyl-diphosphatase UppP [Chthonomonadaceae bacterium]
MFSICDLMPMGWLQAILLGLLQGLTEFLPVSSTAHMAVVPQLFHQRDPGAAFSAIAQLGPIFAIIWFFRAELIRYVRGIIRTKLPTNVAKDDLDARLGWYTLLGSLPIVVFALLLEKRIDREFRSLNVIAFSMIALALVLWLAEWIGRRKVSLDKMTLQQSQGIGWAQVFGLVPGASRSGSTIAAGLLLGLDRESAARFSFLLGIPAITAAGLYKLYKVAKATDLSGPIGPYLLAMVVAGLFAYVVIKWFLGFMKTHDTRIFIAYRIVFGVAILWLLHVGAIKKDIPQSEDTPNSAPNARLGTPVSQSGRPNPSTSPTKGIATRPLATSPARRRPAPPTSRKYDSVTSLLPTNREVALASPELAAMPAP